MDPRRSLFALGSLSLGALGLLLAALALPAAESPSPDLFAALKSSDANAVKRLLTGGVDANAVDADGTPALMNAVLYSGADAVKLLLEHHANPNARNKTGATALMWAVPDLAKTRLLVEAGAEVDGRATNTQRTPFLIAASYPRSVAVLQFLLDHGADIHAKDRVGVHALGRATLSADVDVVRFLVEHGCDPNEPGYGTMVRYARQYLPSLEYLLSKGAKAEPNAIANAPHWQDPSLVAKWIERGADVNFAEGSYKRTALMIAASSEQSGAPMLKLLLEKGANPNAEDSDGERPLDWAIYRNDKEKIAVLQQFGATRGHGPRQKTYPPPAEGGIKDPRVSVEKAVNLLLPAAPAAFEKRGCISCHSQSIVAVAAAEARAKGIAINEKAEAVNLQQMETAYKRFGDLGMQGDQPGGNIIAMGYVMMGFAAEKHPLDALTAQMVHLALGLQLPDGTWTPNGVSRPPIEDTLVTAVAMGIRTLTAIPVPGYKAETAVALERARKWLQATKVRSAEDRAMKLMGLVWSNAPKSDIDAEVRAILGSQREQGGWAQRDDMQPDAYATGILLYAMHVAGVPASNHAYRKGVTYLLRSQYQDGAWFVRTRAYPTQIYFESGYPFGNNQFLSAGAASWSSLAITATLPERVVAKR
ncbi:MAG: ankyrin repeat domain-containing protein [Bryobacteraceae bacterium]